MKLNPRFLVSLSLIVLLLASCTPKADFDIRGEWEYSMTTTDGNTYDIGSMTFSGKDVEGTYLEINIYQVEYEGGFSVNGASITLSGDETWEGAFLDENTITGTWSHSDGASGAFVAIRK